MNNLQPLKWHEQEGWFSTKSPLTEYRITTSIDKYKVFYTKRADKFTREATGFATIDEAKAWAWNHYNEKMQPYVKPDSITDIANWFKKAKPEPNDKDIGVQTGCLLEEVVELLEGFGFAKQGAVLGLHNLAGLFKANTFGSMIAELTQDERIEIVDACCDINVTSVGVMQLLGGVDVLGAQREVIRSNNSKMVKGKFEFDENGKIMKPESYSKPDLTKFVEVTK
tara:strand:+ start:675 stop:1349 length:675 start_codon:yes stop_codon:yes gene_type:complete